MNWKKWLGYLLLFGCLGIGWNCDTKGRPQPEAAIKDGGSADLAIQVDTKNDTTDSAKKEPTKPDTRVLDTHIPEAVAEPTPEPPAPTGLTYYKDIKSILKSKCLNCHQTGGIGPFVLEKYEQVFPLRMVVKSAVKDGRMPPWMSDKACNEYSNDISLSTAEKEKILKWVDTGAKKGDPADYKEPPPAKKIGLSRVDVSLKMKKPFVPTKSPDDHRCFVLDWPYKTKKYITGFQIKAGKPNMVHHAIAYLAHPEYAAKYRKKDPSGGGYYCPGTANGNAGINWLGVWAPGVPGGNYPPGTGLLVDPGSKIVVQIHYNTSVAKPSGDQSSVEFKLEDTVKQKAIMIPFTNFATWTKSKGMKIPKGDPDSKHSFELPLSILGLVPALAGIKELTVYSAMLHMHQLGSKAELYIKKDGEQVCLADIPKWNFDWQLLYHLKKPITVSKSDSIGIVCHFNNTQANQPIVNGVKRTTQDIYWGDGTFDEMCLGLLYVTCGSSVCPKLKF